MSTPASTVVKSQEPSKTVQQFKERISLSEAVKREIAELDKEYNERPIWTRGAQRHHSEESLLSNVAHQLHAIAYNPKSIESYWYWSSSVLSEDLVKILANPDLRIEIHNKAGTAHYDFSKNTLYVCPLSIADTGQYFLSFQSTLSRALQHMKNYAFPKSAAVTPSVPALTDDVEARVRHYIKSQLGQGGWVLDAEHRSGSEETPFKYYHDFSEISKPVETALLQAVAFGGKDQAVGLLKYLGLSKESTLDSAHINAVKLRNDLLLFASRERNLPLVEALLEVGADVASTPDIIRNAIGNKDLKMLDVLLNSRQFETSFLENCILDGKGQLISGIEDSKETVQLLCKFGLNDCIARSVMKYQDWKSVWEGHKIFKNYHWSYAHRLIDRFSSMGVNFQIAARPGSYPATELLDWAMKDPSGIALSVLIDSNPKIIESYISRVESHGDLVWIAAKSNNWKLMQELRASGISLNQPDLVAYLLNNGHDKALTVVLNSGQIPGFKELQDKSSSEKFDSKYGWDSFWSYTNWDKVELRKYLDLSRTEAEAFCGIAGDRRGEYQSIQSMLINDRSWDHLFHHVVSPNKAFLRDVNKAIHERNAEKLLAYFSDIDFARSLRMQPGLFGNLFWETDLVEIAIESDNAALLLKLKEAGFDISIPGVFGYALNHQRYKTLKVLYEEYQRTNLIEGSVERTVEDGFRKSALDRFTKFKLNWHHWRYISLGTHTYDREPNLYRLDVQNYLIHLDSLENSPLRALALPSPVVQAQPVVKVEEARSENVSKITASNPSLGQRLMSLIRGLWSSEESALVESGDLVFTTEGVSHSFGRMDLPATPLGALAEGGAKAVAALGAGQRQQQSPDSALGAVASVSQVAAQGDKVMPAIGAIRSAESLSAIAGPAEAGIDSSSIFSSFTGSTAATAGAAALVVAGAGLLYKFTHTQKSASGTERKSAAEKDRSEAADKEHSEAEIEYSERAPMHAEISASQMRSDSVSSPLRSAAENEGARIKVGGST